MQAFVSDIIPSTLNKFEKHIFIFGFGDQNQKLL